LPAGAGSPDAVRDADGDVGEDDRIARVLPMRRGLAFVDGDLDAHRTRRERALSDV